MPHLIIDYSPNIADRIDLPAFCRHLREAALQTGLFPRAGIRVRAHAADHFAMANDDPAHGYIDITIRLREGRPQEAKEAATAHIFKAAEAFCAPALEATSLMLSMEMRDIDAALSPKVSTIRAHLKEEER